MANQSTDNILLQVTVLGTSNPAVARTLAVPPNENFFQLHHAIEACFGYTELDFGEETKGAQESYASPSFAVVAGNPFRSKKLEQSSTLLRLQVGVDEERVFDMLEVKAKDVFGHFAYRQNYVLYDYDEGFYHAIEFLGQTNQVTANKTTCIGACGHTSRSSWEHGLSSWEVDLNQVQGRLK